MNVCHKSTQIKLRDFQSIAAELHLTKAQVGNTTIASAAITILVRMLVGWRERRSPMAL
ncbi:MAG TPA: hypothetical protein VHW09_14225 [Bryobacteraceae bacterium]|nr:hypothetical protein [Bryobacteraceae bacterium]